MRKRDYKQIVEEYENSVDENLLKLFDDIRKGKSKEYNVLGHVTEKMASDILAVLPNVYRDDFSPIDYEIVVGKSFLEHVESRHGINGKHDNSMADDKDKARIGYAIFNYDSINSGGKSKEYTMIDKNGNDISSPTIGIEKRIDGTMVVAEAVPDTYKRQLVVISAYIKMHKKRRIFEQLDA